MVAPQTGAPVNLTETKEFNTEWGSKKRDGLFRLWGGERIFDLAAGMTPVAMGSERLIYHQGHDDAFIGYCAAVSSDI